MFVNFHLDLLFTDPDLFNRKLAHFFILSNTQLPHHALKLTRPIQAFRESTNACQRLWTNTRPLTAGWGWVAWGEEAAMPVVAVSKALRDRLGDEGAEDLAKLLSSVEEAAREDTLVVVEERFARRLAETESRLNQRILETEARLDNRVTEEVAKLEVQIARVDSRITEEVAKLELQIARVDNRITEEVTKLRADMTAFKTEIIKWMFLFWIGQLAAVGGLLALLR
ncbi:LA_3696 family protein [Thermoanaerobaculum aquaticum]|nr:coiled-coil domain-containing protein [Thermoanaerobaculum aquaticum]